MTLLGLFGAGEICPTSLRLWLRRLQCLVKRCFIGLRYPECVCLYYGLRVCSYTHKKIENQVLVALQCWLRLPSNDPLWCVMTHHFRVLWLIVVIWTVSLRQTHKWRVAFRKNPNVSALLRNNQGRSWVGTAFPYFFLTDLKMCIFTQISCLWLQVSEQTTTISYIELQHNSVITDNV